MKNDLRTKLNTALQDVDWNGEDQVLRMVRQQQKPVRRLMPSKALVFAVILMLMLATTAVALTLHFSARYNSHLNARQAVMSEYGLTDEMLDLFTYTEVNDNTNTVATFTMTYAHSDRLGVYTVRRTAEGTLDASWNHDDADAALLASGNLASPAWGAKQLERIMPLYRKQATNWTTELNVGELSFEECAALDAPLLDIQDAGMMIHIAPDQNDLSVEQAEKIARIAITDKYGVPADELSAHDTYISFFLYGGTNRREYRFDINGYIVYVASPSGTVTHCSWMVQEDKRTLPDGDLSLYPIAAKEFITSGAFELLDVEEKAAVTNRYVDAGLADLLPRSDYVAPLDDDLTEDDARRIAAAALEDAYGLPTGWKTLFMNRTSLVWHENRREWVIEYIPYELDNWHWRDFDKLGIYTVSIDAETGDVISYDWSFKDVQLDQYTERDFASAPAYNGSMIPWVQSLLNDLQVILDKYPHQTNLSEMTRVDRGTYSTRMRQAGYPATQYPDLIPNSKDMPQDEAAALAWDALNVVYDLSNLSLVRGEPMQEGLYMVQISDGTWIRVWNIVYTNNMDIFIVHVNTETGEIENIWHDSPAFGNG